MLFSDEIPVEERLEGKEFCRIIQNETKLAKNSWDTPNVNDIYGIAYQIGEVAKSSFVLRAYNNIYGNTKAKKSYESDGAHTNLMAVIVDRAIAYAEALDIDLELGDYTHLEIMEAVRLHDLPENIMGDIPDNGTGNLEKKRINENAYYYVFYKYYSPYGPTFVENVKRLLTEMNDKSSPAGKLLFCADKTAAVIETLQYDYDEDPPILKRNNKRVSERDLREMAICDRKVKGGYLASEMWTIDWFKERKLVDYDVTGFFTSLIVMRTLQINKRWYNWREKDYQ